MVERRKKIARVIIEGDANASDLCIALVASRFNLLVVKRLVDGALHALEAHGANAKDLTLSWVPGAWELPIATHRLARSGAYDAIVCLGAVIRGETPHFDLVVDQCSAGLMKVQLETGVPVAMGVLTTLDAEQAMDRAGGRVGNKGADAALAAVEMARYLRQIRG